MAASTSLFQILSGHVDNHHRVVEVVKNNSINLNDCFKNGYSPLMVAAQNGLVNCVRKLIKHGADVNAVTESGDTALIQAAHDNKHEVLSVLLDRGAEIDHVDEEGMTALMYACSAGSVEAAEELVKAGASCDITDEDGSTALDMAIAGKQWELVEVLSRLGVKSRGNDAVAEESDDDEDDDEDEVADKNEKDEEEKEKKVTAGTWLARILTTNGTPEAVIEVCDEKLVRQEGFGCALTLARVPPSVFNRGYLDGLGITGLGTIQVLLDLHADLHREFTKLKHMGLMKPLCVLEPAALATVLPATAPTPPVTTAHSITPLPLATKTDMEILFRTDQAETADARDSDGSPSKKRALSSVVDAEEVHISNKRHASPTAGTIDATADVAEKASEAGCVFN